MKDAYTLDLETIVGNLFYTLKRNGYDTKKLSYSFIEQYADIIKNSLEEKGKQLFLNLSRDLKRQFLQDRRNIYGECDNKYIVLVKDLTVEELVHRYVGWLPFVIYSTVTNEEVIEKTIELYNLEERDKQKQLIK